MVMGVSVVQDSWRVLFADLANTADWDALSPGQRLLLKERLVALVREPQPVSDGLRVPVLAPNVSRENVDVEDAWRASRACICPPADNRIPVPVRMFSGSLVLVGENLIEVFSVDDLVLLHLTLLLLQRPAPFLRCAHCQLVAPAAGKPNQLYCTPTCRSRASDAKRRA